MDYTAQSHTVSRNRNANCTSVVGGPNRWWQRQLNGDNQQLSAKTTAATMEKSFETTGTEVGHVERLSFASASLEPCVLGSQTRDKT